MKSQELQTENEQLKAQVLGLSETLKASDNKIKFLESEIQNIFLKYQDVLAELNQLNILRTTSNKNQNDSRNY
jgi:chromosome segregation ATPase